MVAHLERSQHQLLVVVLLLRRLLQAVIRLPHRVVLGQYIKPIHIIVACHTEGYGGYEVH